MEKANKKNWQEKAAKIYIYGILDNLGRITYIGRANDVSRRMIEHKAMSVVILDFFYDLETFYINYYRDKGYQLTNSEFIDTSSDYEIGDIVSRSRNKIKKDGSIDKRYSYPKARKKILIVRDMDTDKVYNSIAAASQDTGVAYVNVYNSVYYTPPAISKSSYRQRFVLTDSVNGLQRFLNKFCRVN